MAIRTWITWARKQREELGWATLGMLGVWMGSYLFIGAFQLDLLGLWLDRLYVQDGAVTTAAIVTIVREPAQGRRTSSAEVLVRYHGGTAPNSPLIERPVAIVDTAYRALRERGTTTVTVQYLRMHPTVARPVMPAPDGTFQDLRLTRPHPVVGVALSVMLLAGSIWILFSHVVRLVRPAWPVSQRRRVMWQMMVGTKVVLVLITLLCMEPWHPTPWLDRCWHPMLPLGLTPC